METTIIGELGAMSTHLVNLLSEAYRIAFLVTAACVPLYTIYVYWRIHSVYKALDDRAKRLGFLWYSFQFQLPILAKGMNEYLNELEVSDDARAHIDRVRYQLRCVRIGFLVWIILVLGFGTATALLRRNH